MKLPVYTPPQVKKKVIPELIEGFAYLKQVPSIGLVILMLAIVSLLVMPYDTLLPVYAKVIFKGNAATFGYITSFIGLGAVSGTVLLASIKKETNLRMYLLGSTIILGIGLIAFSHTSNFPLAMLFATISGFGTVAQATISNILIQSESKPHMRGRAISIMIMAMFGMLPLGSLVVGAVSQRIGATDTLLFQGIAGLFISAAFFKLLRTSKTGNAAKFQINNAEEIIIEEV